jgi:ABC-type branched-subunit amino acid transport system ATPase component
MAVLMEAADRIVAINYGSKLAEGTPDEVVNNDDVIEAYLGRGWREYA